MKVDLQEAAGSLQICAVQIAGIEAAVHTMREATMQRGCPSCGGPVMLSTH